MITARITNKILESILAIEQCRGGFQGDRVPPRISSRLRKNSRKKSSYSSAKIEGNPLTEEQANRAIEDEHRHFLKPEEEVRNYYRALEILDAHLEQRTSPSMELLLEVQQAVIAGASSEKIGLRGPMPPGVLFAVYDSATGAPEYIPPEASDILPLLNELFAYVEASDDHPLVKAAVIHYQIATIHPFEDGNGRTARLLSGYWLDLSGYSFGGIGSLEEYFAYDVNEYYAALQMGLPALFYEGRENPPHPEIWIEYFLRMVTLYAQRTSEIAADAANSQTLASLSHASPKARAFYERLTEHSVEEFTPVSMAREMGVTNRTIINWSAELAQVGLLEPRLVKQRIRSYRVVG
ncbi:Fic family protein [Parvibacter caecicola]|uniref:Fic family protein n=1 Tax=Parvibacter caecicola TaxID=747645 RepID=UPI00272F69F5|nr:Fic family protein [Parvibacter caecicola]